MRITTLCVPTRDRSENLRRLTQDIRLPSIERLVVADTSSSHAEVTANASMLASCAADGMQVLHVTDEFRERLVLRLSAIAGLRPEIISFGLLRPKAGGSFGANQNVLALLNVGTRVLTVDDDMRLASFRYSRSDSRRALREDHPEETWFFDDEATMFRCLERIERDPVLIASEAFGRERPCRKTKAVVFGTVGDSGMGGSEYVAIAANGPTKSRVHASARRYSLARKTRLIVKHSRNGAVVPMQPFMTAAYAVDHSFASVPFFPAGRGSDRSWAHLTAAAFGSVDIHYLPCALWHDVRPPRSGYRSARTISVPEILVAAIGEWSSPGNHGLPDFGEHLRSLARTNVDGFRHKIIELVESYFEQAIAAYSHALQPHDVAQFVVDDLLTINTRLWDRRRTSIGLLMKGRPLFALRDVIGSYADLCIDWQRIVTAALEFQSESPSHRS